LGVPLRDASGQVVGALCAYDESVRAWEGRDVTVLEELAAAVVAELERIALTAEHEAVRTRLDLALDVAGVGSWDWDHVRGELAWDDRLRRLYDYDESAGTPVEHFTACVHPEDLPRLIEALTATATRGEEYDEVFRVLRRDGSVRWVSAHGRALHDRAGRTLRVIGAATDVTDQHVAATENATARTLLQLVSEAGRDLTGSLEVDDAVRGLARRMVPELADWSMVTLVTTPGHYEDVETWHRDPTRRDAVRRLARHRFEGRTEPQGSLRTLTTGEPFVLESGGRDFALRTLRAAPAVEALHRLDLESIVVLPLVGAKRVQGLITLARGGGRPPMNDAELSAALEISVRASTALEHARSYGKIRDLSEQLQRSLLTKPARPDGMRVAVRYTPASEAAQVGGDWYDAFVQPDGSAMLVIGDVIGHDSAAAAAMGQLRSLTRGIAYSSGGTPAEVLSRVADAIGGLRMDTIATALVARLTRDDATGCVRMQWSNAGHPPALVVRPGEPPVLLENHDLLLGLVDDEQRTDQELVLDPGSLLLLFTDGLVERRGEHIGDGLDQLLDVVDSGRDLPLEELVRFVHDRLVPAEPEDDVAVIALRVEEP
ncbi:MAG: SpoIIE family protein phosphatase, partial [Nocardioidaceae bacterium]|nr:SpoIIE family protein phosphatase [Nocardioidaceae bacterium]